MSLTRADKERISDSRMKIRSINAALTQIDPAKVLNLTEIQECLEDAEESLKGTLLAAQAEEQV